LALNTYEHEMPLKCQDIFLECDIHANNVTFEIDYLTFIIVRLNFLLNMKMTFFRKSKRRMQSLSNKC